MRRCLSLTFSFLLLAFSALAQDFKPVDPAELALQDNPQQPGAHAMVLEWTDDTDDTNSNEKIYYRIKIFTAEGKKHADIEIPFFKGHIRIKDIKARTIKPDGTIVPFNGQIYDKMVVKSKDLKFMAKTFTLPDVQPGSIIEYRYTKAWDSLTLYDSHWAPQTDMFVKKARFTLKANQDPNNFYGSYWQSFRLPVGMQVKETKDKRLILEFENMPAFAAESYMPPEGEIKPRVAFYYSTEIPDKDFDKYWREIGKKRHQWAEEFIGNRGGIKSAVATIIAPSDTNEQKLQKIYARVQQIQNRSYIRELSSEEEKKQKIKDNEHVEDVWKAQKGYRQEINRLFVALARAAGFQAGVVRVSQRDEFWFKKNFQNSSQLNNEVAVVTLDGKDVYLDPGTPYCPFGLLSWENTGVAGLRLNKEGGTFIETPLPNHSQAATVRTARLKLEDGALKGKVYVQFRGQDALRWRLRTIEQDDAGFHKELEEEAETWFPGGSTVKMAGVKDPRVSSQTMDVEFDVELVGIGSNVGSRVLLQASVFQSVEKNPFRFEKRVHPVYFRYPYQELDEVSIEIPQGLNVENLPQDVVNQSAFAYYDNKWSRQGNQLLVQRRFAMMGFLFRTDHYPALREFFEKVNTRDQEAAVLRAGN